ncbi:3-hydroxybutyryl-CoA dehydrogenase [Sulfodiicoccus acidiphilus]|uniref:3-hydroxybutyryl-CoA dehydrogenase n=3 Tax=Sulfodiicoccus acidiphilus TaxID=1670455 RepID=A0A830H5S6_9CREN|nr:3-hydroxybutyryl-CoA dehydrogenase [Sulfodiicoccus acidiphilus]
MGAGIAQVSAMNGYDTVVVDVAEEFLARGRERILDSLNRLSRRGQVREVNEVVSRLTFSKDYSAGKGANVAIEAVPEKLDLKVQVFRNLEEILGPEALLSTNTSSIPISEIASSVEFRERVVGLHFFNPPPLMPLVEIIPSKFTSETALERGVSFARSLGKVPVKLAYEVPGFVSNRVFIRLLQEACREVEAGEATIEEVDATARALGLPMGMFELADYTGIDVIVDIWRVLKDRGMTDVPCSLYFDKVKRGELGVKSGRGFYSYPTPGKFVKPNIQTPPKVPFARLISLAVNEAAWLVSTGVVKTEDVDTVMRLGFNFPKGLVQIGRELGLSEVERHLREISKRGFAAYEPIGNLVGIFSR